jgi:putative sterol carrier protein
MGNYARVRSVAEGIDRSAADGLDTVMARVAVATGAAGERGVLQVSLSHNGNGGRHRWAVSLEDHQARAVGADRPDVEMLTSVETFWQLADGSYSPVEAFLNGRLRVRGDKQLGKRVLRHLAGPEGSVDCQ